MFARHTYFDVQCVLIIGFVEYSYDILQLKSIPFASTSWTDHRDFEMSAALVSKL